jgi:hypothetical protein
LPSAHAVYTRLEPEKLPARRPQRPQHGVIPIASATYNANTHQVILLPAYHINIHHDYEITAVFPASSCTRASIYSKIFASTCHPVMIPVANPVILTPATTKKA